MKNIYNDSTDSHECLTTYNHIETELKFTDTKIPRERNFNIFCNTMKITLLVIILNSEFIVFLETCTQLSEVD